MKSDPDTLLALRALLQALPPGLIQDKRPVEDALEDAWEGLNNLGREGGMKAEKIGGRLEKLEWHPPMLSFQIERHAGTINWSSRAEMQRWQVDVEKGSREFVSSGHRQLQSMATRWDHKGPAKMLTAAIRSGQDHEGLRWQKNGQVTINRKIMPTAVAQTTEGRVKRLAKAIGEELGDPSWREKAWR